MILNQFRAAWQSLFVFLLSLSEGLKVQHKFSTLLISPIDIAFTTLFIIRSTISPPEDTRYEILGEEPNLGTRYHISMMHASLGAKDRERDLLAHKTPLRKAVWPDWPQRAQTG
jgi:hypothetical protein